MNTYINCRKNRRTPRWRRFCRRVTIPAWVNTAINTILGLVVMAIMFLFTIGLMAQGPR